MFPQPWDPQLARQTRHLAQPALQIAHEAFQAPRMSSQDLQDVILVPTWQPPTRQTLQNPPVSIGVYYVSQMLDAIHWKPILVMMVRY